MILAERDKLEALVETLSEAFIEDPALCWIWPDRVERQQRYPYSFRALARAAISHGLAFRSPDDTAASLWRLPGRIHTSRIEDYRNRGDNRRAFATGGQRADILGKSLHARMPQGEFWYLQLVGVRPDMRGRGQGRAAIRAGLDPRRQGGHASLRGND